MWEEGDVEERCRAKGRALIGDDDGNTHTILGV